MFDSHIDFLNKSNLLSKDKAQLLRELQLTNYEQIISLLSLDTNKKTVLALSDLCGGIGNLLDKAERERVIQSFVVLLNSLDWEVRQKAVEMIGRLNAYNQLPTLAKIATSDDHDFVRQRAVYELQRWRLPSSAPLLILIASDNNQSIAIREQAIEAIGELSTNETIPFLISQLEDKSPRIRYSAVIALHNTQLPEVITHLEKLMTDEAEIRKGETIADRVRETIAYLKSK